MNVFQSALQTITGIGAAYSNDDQDEARALAVSSGMPIGNAFASIAPTTLTGYDALSIAAVYACIQVIRNTTSSLERKIVKLNGDKWDIDEAHPSNILLRRANSYMTFTELMRIWQSTYLIEGNSIIVPVRNPSTQTEELHWRPNAWMTVYEDIDTRQIYYIDREFNVVYHSSEVGHLKDIYENPYWGTSRLQRASKITGKIKATDDLINKLSTKGLLMGGAVLYDKDSRSLSPEVIERQERHFNAINGGGLKNAGRWTFLQGGAKLHQLKMDMNLTEAQAIPSTHLAIEDICRFYNCPPHKIQHLVKASYNSFEHLQINFMQDAIKPDVQLMQEQLDKVMFKPSELNKYRMRFISETLDMTDTAGTIDALTKAVGSGLLNLNEARAKMNLNPIKDGDKYLVAANNLQPLSQVVQNKNKDE